MERQAGFPAFESSFNYMDGGVNYSQYPSPSSSTNFSSSLNLMNEYTYSSATFSSQEPPRSFPPTTSQTMLLFNVNASEPFGHTYTGHARGGSGIHSPVAYPATVASAPVLSPSVLPSEPQYADVDRARATMTQDPQPMGEPILFTEIPSTRQSASSTLAHQSKRQREGLNIGYARLNDTLPPSNRKTSKVYILHRAASYIEYLEAINNRLQEQFRLADQEVHRLRQINETLVLKDLPLPRST